MKTEVAQPDAPAIGGEPQFAVDRFWRAVSAFADLTALEVDGASYTYAALGEKIATIQEHLAREDDGARRVAVLDQRGVTTYAGYLAVLSAARTAVPLNRRWPRERLHAVLGAAQVGTVLLEEGRDPAIARDLADAGYTVLDTGPISDGTPVAVPVAPAAPRAASDEVYLLFTSGTTGRPKGVPISEANLAAYLGHVGELYALGPGDRASQLFGLTFDPSVHDIFVTLAAGATLVVPTATEALLPSRYVRRRRLTHWFSVPSAVSLGVRFGALEPESMPTLRASLFVGEPLTKEHARLWSAAAPASVVDNVYGPTEMTIACAVHRLHGEGPAVTSNGTVPIGRPYPHVPFRVLDDTGQGGELVVGGSQMFAGYLDPADDDGRFVDVEEVAEGVTTTSRYYRTGDRVRWEGDALVHLGRVDRQVKLDGFRIELSEVEAELRDLTGLTDLAVVVCRGGGTPHLAAMVASASPEREALTGADALADLPDHQRPRHTTGVATLPLSGNGKVDHGAIGEVLLEACPLGSDS